MVQEVVRETVLRAVGNSVGVTIPKATLDRLNWAEGDKITLLETQDGLVLKPYNPELSEAMAIYEEGMRMYRNAMRALADQ